MEGEQNNSKGLVLFEPVDNRAGESESVPDPTGHWTSGVEYIRDFAVQCASCFKWRLIPTEEKYMEIREHINKHPFLCKTAREWRPSITCNDPTDIAQDGSWRWAFDKCSIPQPPPGWQRRMKIRSFRNTKYADVYYEAPSKEQLRSLADIHKYLDAHPLHIEDGVNLSQFSFETPVLEGIM
ncbi:Methyl-CpG-binding domain-containing protein 2 [Forsythia ovata]|uniref:Methyl-CpG-binding domain-containing protein 2 n=1 Tax=Forsythia ovata TaxID=205694 RepID=A0ABD1SRA8_9LAMI